MPNIFKKLTAAIAVFIISISACIPIVGCGFFSVAVTGISFTRQEIEMCVGDERDIAMMVKIAPALASDKRYSLTSSDSSIVEVNGTTLIAHEKGCVTITAQAADGGATASLKVFSYYALPDSLQIGYNGSLMQYSNDVTVIDFFIALDPYTDPALVVEWYIDGVYTSDGKAFSFKPQENTAGQYTITAAIKDTELISSAVVSVYNPFQTLPILVVDDENKLTQENTYKSVNFSLSYISDPQNPPDSIVWTVNGEVQQNSNNRFTYLPQAAGVYEIAALVNGIAAITNKGATHFIIRVSGSIMITGLRAGYSKTYPDTLIEWDVLPADLDVQIKIKNLTTGAEKMDYIRTNTSFARYFTHNTFKATNSVMDIARYSYEIYARVLGDNGLYTDGNYSAPVRVNKIADPTAIKYLEQSYFNGNYYITSDEEFFDLFNYKMVFRGDMSAESYEVYMAYAPTLHISDLVAAAFERTLYTGTYYLSAKQAGKIATVTITFKTGNNPTEYIGAVGDNTRNNLNAFLPHINYNEQKYRPANYKFKVDGKAKTASDISTGEQLYFVLESGAKPQTVAGSPAAKMYAYARDVLRRICTDDMDDFEKAHAIYDWIMWRVNYDYEASYSPSIEASTLLTAYYIDSVFTYNAFGDVPAFAVCDGISKAYSVMCNIEGIECMRVGGSAGVSGDFYGHAWNKVKINGNWYIVDCTWGDYEYTVGGRAYEMGTHEYLFLTDHEAAATHFEKPDAGYPKAVTSYNYYSRAQLYVNDYDNANKQIYNIIESFLNSKGDYKGLLQIPGDNGTESVVWYGVEIKISDALATRLSAAQLRTMVVYALKSYDLKASKKIGDNYTINYLTTFNNMLQVFILATH